MDGFSPMLEPSKVSLRMVLISRSADTHLELHAFHCFPPCSQAAKAGLINTKVTVSSLHTVIHSAGVGWPAVNTTLPMTS